MVRVGHSFLHYHPHFFTGARREEGRHPAADGGWCAGGPGGEQPQRLRQVGHPHNNIRGGAAYLYLISILILI